MIGILIIEHDSTFLQISSEKLSSKFPVISRDTKLCMNSPMKFTELTTKDDKSV